MKCASFVANIKNFMKHIKITFLRGDGKNYRACLNFCTKRVVKLFSKYFLWNLPRFLLFINCARPIDRVEIFKVSVFVKYSKFFRDLYLEKYEKNWEISVFTLFFSFCSTWWLYVTAYCKKWLIKQSFFSNIINVLIELCIEDSIWIWD